MDCSPPDFFVHGIFQQEYWNGLPFPSTGDLPDPRIEPMSLVSPALAGDFFDTAACGNLKIKKNTVKKINPVIYMHKYLRGTVLIFVTLKSIEIIWIDRCIEAWVYRWVFDKASI